MTTKFKLRDKVVVKRLNRRTPQYIRDAIRLDKDRTIVSIYYDSRTQHAHYHLGKKPGGVDISMYPFRASELRLKTESVGRPREKRKYGRKVS